MSCDRGENQRCDTFRSGAKKHFPKRDFVVNVYGKRCQEGMGSVIPIKFAERPESAKSGKCGLQANLALRKLWHLRFVKTSETSPPINPR